MLSALGRLCGSAWQGHFNSSYYEGEWSGIALISAVDAPTELAPGQGVAVRRGPWLADPDWALALQTLPVDICSARLLRLGAGGRIHEHRDPDLHGPDADRRLHIPLFSPPHVDFLLEGQRIPMRAGECWFLDLARRHSVDNWGHDERVHLVLDVRPNPWLDLQIAEGLMTTPALGVGRAAQAFARFREWVASDPQLSEALQAETETEPFIARVLELAHAQGLSFTREEVRSAMREGRRGWNQQWMT